MIILIIDTETTGLIKHPSAKDEVQPRIIEFAGMLVESTGMEAPVIVDEMDVLINPGQPLEEKITKITGLTDDDLKDKPGFIDVADEIRAMFAMADVLVAHNLPFDSGMVKLELARAGIKDWPWPVINVCTVQEHVEEWGYRPKLTQLYEHYVGKPLAQSHRALDDVKALFEVCRLCGVIV